MRFMRLLIMITCLVVTEHAKSDSVKVTFTGDFEMPPIFIKIPQQGGESLESKSIHNYEDGQINTIWKFAKIDGKEGISLSQEVTLRGSEKPLNYTIVFESISLESNSCVIYMVTSISDHGPIVKKVKIGFQRVDPTGRKIK